jgi:hypothetical protein
LLVLPVEVYPFSLPQTGLTPRLLAGLVVVLVVVRELLVLALVSLE